MCKKCRKYEIVALKKESNVDGSAVCSELRSGSLSTSHAYGTEIQLDKQPIPNEESTIVCIHDNKALHCANSGV